MKKQSKIQKAAILAKKQGYAHIYSVVKTHFSTTYCHVNDVDYVIINGWRPAPYLGNFNCKAGITLFDMHENCEKVISRQAAYSLVDRSNNRCAKLDAVL